MKKTNEEKSMKCSVCGLRYTPTDAMSRDYECCSYIAGSDEFIPTIEEVR